MLGVQAMCGIDLTTLQSGSFWPLVRGSKNWFHPMWLYLKCFNLKGEFKSSISPHLLGYAVILIYPHYGDSKAGFV